MYVCVSSCAHVCVRVCVNKIPANKVQWPGTDENPLGESLLDVDPPPLPLPLLILYHLSLLASEHDGEAGGGGGGRTEPCEWGDEQLCGPLCQPQTRIREIVWNSLLG